jgi:hypothetical protein
MEVIFIELGSGHNVVNSEEANGTVHLCAVLT